MSIIFTVVKCLNLHPTTKLHKPKEFYISSFMLNLESLR